ncbi:Probable membrane-associated kinase regulator 6 [Linum perenne]
MEASSLQQQRPLSIESFSYSWLVNLKPDDTSSAAAVAAAAAAADDYEESSSFIEMDPRMPPSKRFFPHHQDFNFDFPEQSPPMALVHADELFSDGYLMPFFLTSTDSQFTKKSEGKDCNYDSAILSSSGHDCVEYSVGDRNQPDSTGLGERMRTTRRCSSLRRCGKLSKRMFEKYLDFIRRRFHGGGRIVSRKSRSEMSSKVSATEVVNSKIGAKRWNSSAGEVSPRISVAYSIGRRSSCDSESSIYEAVLHCKRSIHGE